MKTLFSLTILIVFLYAVDTRAQQYFTELNGFRLGQAREAPRNEFGAPDKNGKYEDGVEYEAFLLKPDASIYMIFEYSPGQPDINMTVQITGTDARADIGFRGLRFGMTAAEVEKQAGKPTKKENVGEYGTRWDYKRSNFSFEINKEGKLSSIKLLKIPDDAYPETNLKQLPHFEELLKVLTTGSNSDIARLVLPDMELYREGKALYFGRSFKSEIASDSSGVFAAIRSLSQELKSIDYKKPEDYEENARLTQGQSSKHVMKFKKGGKIKEIVFKYQWGEYLIWEFDAGRPPKNNWSSYTPRTLEEFTSVMADKLLKDPDIVLYDSKKRRDIILSHNSYQSQIKVVYTGRLRKVSDRRKAVVDMWFQSYGQKKETPDLFENEYLFNENNVEYWLPVQKPLEAFFQKELKNGDNITILVAWLGGRVEPSGFDNVFFVNEFEKD